MANLLRLSELFVEVKSLGFVSKIPNGTIWTMRIVKVIRVFYLKHSQGAQGTLQVCRGGASSPVAETPVGREHLHLLKADH